MDGNTIISTAVVIVVLIGFSAVTRGLMTPVAPECEELLGIDAIEAHVAARTGHRHL